MTRVVIATVWLVLAPVSLNAQSAQGQSDLEVRLRALEEQVKALQAEIASVRCGVGQPVAPAPGAPAPAGAQPAPAVPAALGAAPTGSDVPAPAQLPVYGPQSTKLFNPDIGIIGNFIGATGESRGGSDSVAPFRSLTLQESEASRGSTGRS